MKFLADKFKSVSILQGQLLSSFNFTRLDLLATCYNTIDPLPSLSTHVYILLYQNDHKYFQIS